MCTHFFVRRKETSDADEISLIKTACQDRPIHCTLHDILLMTMTISHYNADRLKLELEQLSCLSGTDALQDLFRQYIVWLDVVEPAACILEALVWAAMQKSASVPDISSKSRTSRLRTSDGRSRLVHQQTSSMECGSHRRW